MSETYTCKMKIEKPNLDKLDFIDKNINSEYIDSYYQNNIRYHGVNKIYKTTKSFIDTIFYSTGAGFIKFVINQKEYIVK